ncbi:MAG: nucleoside diphosphate kinase regulator [Caldilineaceae bacterium]|nr:nucleoside diphosphate kinase regulator [Caldilineaceae bacterium]
MEGRTIYITEFDMERLGKLIEEAKRVHRHGNAYLDDLELELSRAEVVLPADVPPDVVTMNSTVWLRDLDTDEEMTVTLVFPQDADIEHDKVSVLAPIGTAMLGYRAGDVFTWKVPDGERRLRIEKVPYQPEASGDLHL